MVIVGSEFLYLTRVNFGNLHFSESYFSNLLHKIIRSGLIILKISLFYGYFCHLNLFPPFFP